MADDEQDPDAPDTAAEVDEVADDDAATSAVDPNEDAELEQDDEDALPEPSEAKRKADAVIAERRAKDPSVAKEAAATGTGERKVERRVVTSRRVTPKAGAAANRSKAKDAPPASESKARDAKKTESVLRTSPPNLDAAKLKGPSPWWVPALMFGLMIVGALIIMANYMGAFGDPNNIRLVIGLVLILGGIITATQYR